MSARFQESITLSLQVTSGLLQQNYFESAEIRPRVGAPMLKQPQHQDAQHPAFKASTLSLWSLDTYTHFCSCSTCFLHQRTHCRSKYFPHRKENCG